LGQLQALAEHLHFGLAREFVAQFGKLIQGLFCFRFFARFNEGSGLA
jgi:hypothetical protein